MFCRFLVFWGASVTLAVAQSDPAWWSNVTRSGGADNYAPANLGQLKHFADQARVHLDAKLVNGSGSEIGTMVAGWSESPAVNYAPVNLGQLKFVADKFYARFDAVGFDYKLQLIANGYGGAWTADPNGKLRPWNESTPVADNYAPANLGQLKMAFSFDLATFDTDLDVLPDSWEQRIVNFSSTDAVSTIAQVLSGGDFDHDGLTNLQEFQAGLDPTNPDSDFDGISDKQEGINGSNPNDSTSVTSKRLAYFSFDDASFQSFEGQLPRVASGVTSVDGWSGKAARIADNGQLLTYDWKRADGSPNYSFTRGTIRLWVKPDWSSTTMSGTWSRIYQIGAPYGFGKAYSMIRLHAANSSMAISEADGNGHFLDYESVTPFTWAANTWHQIVYTYTPTNRRIYVDGVLVGATTAAWTHPPKVSDIIDGGLTLGNEGPEGLQPLKGAVDEIEIFNYELTSGVIAQQYTAVTGSSTDSDGDGLSDPWESSHGSDPNNYFSQGGDIILPQIFVYSGGGAWVSTGQFSAAPIVYKVINRATGASLVNAPVSVAVTDGQGTLGLTSGGSASTTVAARSDAQGLVRVYFKAP